MRLQMEKVLKNKCSLEEEYAFEHNQRIKAEKYIEEVWQFNQELTNEVIRLQKIINEGRYAQKITSPRIAKNKLNLRLKKIYEEREKAINKFEKRLRNE